MPTIMQVVSRERDRHSTALEFGKSLGQCDFENEDQWCTIPSSKLQVWLAPSRSMTAPNFQELPAHVLPYRKTADRPRDRYS